MAFQGPGAAGSFIESSWQSACGNQRRPDRLQANIDKIKKVYIIQKQGDAAMGLEYIGILIPFAALSIPIVAITLSYKQKAQKNRIKELELQKEILELEIEKQNGKVKLLEEENKKYDKIINDKN
ncbi:MAG: hypothetical protein LBF74_14110 [Treponema sp.]|nr:hypothetical protein [Treponema sp.]